MTAEQKQALYRRLFMPINLNAATREEIARSIAELDELIGEMLLASRLGALDKLIIQYYLHSQV